MRTRRHIGTLIILSSLLCLSLLLGSCGSPSTPAGTPTPSVDYPYPYETP